MAKIECPYCAHVYELCTDDGRMSDTDVTHQEQCVNCQKWFTFQTEITYSHYCSTADCLNGDKHVLKFENTNFTSETLLFHCKTCDNRFDTENVPVLKNMFFNGEVSSDFEFNESLFTQFGFAIPNAIWNYEWALKSYIYFFNETNPQYPNYYKRNLGHKLQHLLAAAEAKETIMQAFATLFPNECADIYRC